MTRLKSAYRPKAYRDGGAVMADDIAQIKVPTGAADVPDGLESGGVIGDGSAIADDASLAFRTQIENLLRAEEASKHRSEASPQPTSRSQRLEQLRQEGLSEAAISFLAANPEIMDTPQLADQAARAARNEGHQLDTPEFFQSVRSNFQRIAAPAEEDKPSNSALETAQKYSGGVSMPPVAEEAALERDTFNRAAAMVSAPVSRDVPTANREDRRGTLTLSVAQREAARISGLSEVEYGRNLLRLREEKAADPDRYGS